MLTYASDCLRHFVRVIMENLLTCVWYLEPLLLQLTAQNLCVSGELKCFLFTLMKLNNQVVHQKKRVHLSIISPVHAFTEHTNIAIFEFGSSEGYLCYLILSISSYLMSNKVTSGSIKILFSVSFTENNENFEVFFGG